MNKIAAESFSSGVDHFLVREVYAKQDTQEKSLQKTLGTYLKLLQHIGFWSGTRIFIQLQFNFIQRLVIPNIEHPVFLRKGTSDVLAFHQVFLYKEYNIEFKEKPRVIIDGGANIGLFTVLMKNRFPEAKVICIEPDKENFQQLQKNVSAYENVFCENSGIWHKEAKLKVWDKFEIGKWAMVVEENEYNWNVGATSIDGLMKKHQIDVIDVLKLDIESSEKELFSENYSQWLSKTKMIIIELHDLMKEGCARQFFQTINKTFQDYEFSIKGENVVVVNKRL